MTIVDNPLRDLALTTEARDPAVAAFHARLPDYAATPIHVADDLAATLGVAQVVVKDEASRLGLPAFKMLGASWATYRLLEQTRGEPFAAWTTIDELRQQVASMGALTLAAATDGNHGRAVARMARWLGFSARIRVPVGTVSARIDAIASEGAEVTVSDGNYDTAVAEVAAWADDTTLVVSDTSWEGYQDVPAWIIDGYSTIFAELDEQLAAAGLAAPTAIFVPVGVGAFGASVVDWARSPGGPGGVLVAVEPDDAACVMESARAGELVTLPGEQRSIMAGLNCGTPSPVAWPRLSAGTDAFAVVSDDDARAAMRQLAAAGIESGESGAASLAGASQFAAAGRLTADDRVLLLSTEGITDPEAYAEIVG